MAILGFAQLPAETRIPSAGSNRPSHKVCTKALCARPRHSLDHHYLFFCPATHRQRNCDLAPALLLGRDGHRFDGSFVSTARGFPGCHESDAQSLAR